MVLPLTRRPLPFPVTPATTMPFPMKLMPWRHVSGLAEKWTPLRFGKLLESLDPSSSIAYFWPGAPTHSVRRAKELGFVTVREMINTYRGTAKNILDQAYIRHGLQPTHGITDESVIEERAELALYDYVCAPAPGVESSLAEAGVPHDRILSGTFGWSPTRFGGVPDRQLRPRNEGKIRFLFVGMAGVRKGIPELLAAWRSARVEGELVIVGDVEPAVRHLFAAEEGDSSIQHVGFTEDLVAHYRDADVFVFPTHEEGCPQVVMEAGGCGLPVITTSMGAGRLVKHGRNGLLVQAGNIQSLAEALRCMSTERDTRESMARQIREDAKAFVYGRVGREKGLQFIDLLEQRAG